MIRRLAPIGLLCALLGGSSLFATMRLTGQVAPSQTELPSCEWNEGLFPSPSVEELQEASTAEIWSTAYHERVREIIGAHLAPPGESLVCAPRPVRYASIPLIGIAEYLSPWIEDGAGSLEESAMGSVLLEYLRVYECSLRQRWFLLPTFIAEEIGSVNALDELFYSEGDNEDTREFEVGDFLTQLQAEQQFIQTELELARPALHQTLASTVGHDRLLPIDGTMECLARVSMDLSNELGLAANVSACLVTRGTDVRGSVFEIPTL